MNGFTGQMLRGLLLIVVLLLVLGLFERVGRQYWAVCGWIVQAAPERFTLSREAVAIAGVGTTLATAYFLGRRGAIPFLGVLARSRSRKLLAAVKSGDANVVVVQYPAEFHWMLGIRFHEAQRSGMSLVFVPSVPVPATGMLIWVPNERLREIDIPWADLATVIMTLGTNVPESVTAEIDRVSN